MTYVDGFVLVIKKNKLKEYKKMAQDGGKLWKKHGALEYLECVGDDMTPSGPMKVLTFPKMTKTKKDETVIFSFITYKSRKHRDEVNKRVIKDMMNDPKNKNMTMPFDMKKMAYGGFNAIVEF